MAAQPKPRLLHALRDNLRLRHFSPHTEEAYTAWVRRFVRAGLLFLYREVLGVPISGLGPLPRARQPTRLPVVLTRADCSTAAVFGSWRR